MVRGPFYDENGIKRGAWSPKEDDKLRDYIEKYGHWNWRELPKFAGLSRCGKSCRLRWMNYLRPDVKRGSYSLDEEALILRLHQEHGNKWSLIAAQLPGRTDNEVKNYWHTHLKKRTRISTNDPQTCQDLSTESSHQLEQIITSSCDIVLESSRLSPADKSFVSSSTTSTEYSSGPSLVSSIGPASTTNLGLAEENNSLSASPFEVCSQDYYGYSAGSDFWTEPFVEDSSSYLSMPRQNEYQNTCYSPQGAGILSPPYPSFYDEAMDYLYNTTS